MALVKNTSKINNALTALKEKMAKEREERLNFNDANVVTFQPNNKYMFRLLFSTNEETGRTSPFIVNHFHAIKIGDKKQFCTCAKNVHKTKWWEHCKLCSLASTLFKSNAKVDQDMYNEIKNQFEAYVPVVVLYDKTTPENVNHVKVMRMGYGVYAKLTKLIFGVGDGSDSSEADEIPEEFAETSSIVGDKAFDLENGVSLIVETTPNKRNVKWCEYDLKFTTTSKPISTDIDIVEKEFETLNFDKYTRVFDATAVDKIYNALVEGSVESTKASDADCDLSNMDELDGLSQTNKKTNKTTTSNTTQKTNTNSKVAEETDESDIVSDDELDELING